MPPGWEAWLEEHIWTALLMAATLEGMGLPVPAEAMLLAAGGLPWEGPAPLALLALTAAVGNLTGAMTGFALAWLGGPAALEAVLRLLHIPPGAAERAGRLFARYGAAAVFLSRFIGIIRAPLIYTAGAARMAPWRFALSAFGAAMLWNFGWAYLGVRFGGRLPEAARPLLFPGALALLGAAALLLLAALFLRWLRRGSPVDY